MSTSFCGKSASIRNTFPTHPLSDHVPGYPLRDEPRDGERGEVRPQVLPLVVDPLEGGNAPGEVLLQHGAEGAGHGPVRGAQVLVLGGEEEKKILEKKITTQQDLFMFSWKC